MSNRKIGKGMGRKPASIGAYGTQDAIWRAVRELETFTQSTLTQHVNKDMVVNDATVRSYLVRLVAGEYLKVDKVAHHTGVCKKSTYTLVKDTGIETPRLRKDGTLVTQGLGREQMWRTIKILRDFDWKELALAASTAQCQVSEGAAKEYAIILEKAGYLVVSRQGKGSIRTRYRLLPSKYSGPRPPQIQRVKQLFDPNLNRVVWRRGGGE